MIGAIGYFFGCLILAGVLSGIILSFRPIHGRGDSSPGKFVFALFVLLAGGPYLYADILTRMKGRDMLDTVEDVLAKENVNDGLRFYRVVSASSDRARVVAVGLESETTGFTQRPVFAITMVKKDGTWKAEDVTVVNSINRNADSASIPPYW